MTQQKKRKPVYVSPAGIAVHPWLTNPDTAVWQNGVKVGNDPDKGIYKTGLRLTSEEFSTAIVGGKPFQQFIDELVDESVTMAKEKYPKDKKAILPYYPYRAETDDNGDETGTIEVQFRQNAKIRRKDGTVINVTVPLFDRHGQRIDKLVYGGSIIKVAFTTRPIWMQATKQAGVRLDISAVQVLKLQTNERSATDYGFDIEEGGAPDMDDEDSLASIDDQPVDF